jgi:hypothetical protein
VDDGGEVRSMITESFAAVFTTDVSLTTTLMV